MAISEEMEMKIRNEANVGSTSMFIAQKYPELRESDVFEYIERVAPSYASLEKAARKRINDFWANARKKGYDKNDMDDLTNLVQHIRKYCPSRRGKTRAAGDSVSAYYLGEVLLGRRRPSLSLCESICSAEIPAKYSPLQSRANPLPFSSQEEPSKSEIAKAVDLPPQDVVPNENDPVILSIARLEAFRSREKKIIEKFGTACYRRLVEEERESINRLLSL